ncbi:MAG: Rid family hydrolase, partial [Rikenellaceae bacterium]
GRRLLRITVYGSPTDNNAYMRDRDMVEAALHHNYRGAMPVWSYVAQPPFESIIAAEVWFSHNEQEWYIENVAHAGVDYIRMRRGEVKRILVGGLSALHRDQRISIYDQSKAICGVMDQILRFEQIPIRNIVRQWNYIERITFEDENNQHYQEFNDARSELYSKCEWTYGYPAATGIGALSGGVVIDFDATVGEEIIPIDNELQVAAHAYSKGVLIGEKSQKTTPKFERAKLSGDLMYISGTAAIRGEESLVGVSAAEQTRITLENIDELLRNGTCSEARSLKVYIKYREDFEQIRDVVECYAPYDALYLFADICRDELLMEIEALAYRD